MIVSRIRSRKAWLDSASDSKLLEHASITTADSVICTFLLCYLISLALGIFGPEELTTAWVKLGGCHYS